MNVNTILSEKQVFLTENVEFNLINYNLMDLKTFIEIISPLINNQLRNVIIMPENLITFIEDSEIIKDSYLLSKSKNFTQKFKILSEFNNRHKKNLFCSADLTEALELRDIDHIIKFTDKNEPKNIQNLIGKFVSNEYFFFSEPQRKFKISLIYNNHESLREMQKEIFELKNNLH